MSPIAQAGERIEAIPFRIPFRTPFATSSITHRVRDGLLVRIHAGGTSGIGEASPLPSLGAPAVAAAVAILRQDDGEGVPPWVRFGIDTARLDLEGRRRGLAICKLLEPAARSSVPVNATLTAGAPEAVAADAADAQTRGFGTVKIKVALGGVDDDERRLAAVRARCGARLRIRIDANQGWTEAGALAALSRLERFDLEYVEQPVPADDLEALARVRERSPVLVAADEAVTGADAARRIAALRAADVLIVKPARVGGFGPARDIAEIARGAGLKFVLTSTIDSSIGVAAALHLAASLPDLELACGLATGTMLAGDVVGAPLGQRGGAMTVPNGPGLGVTLDDDQLARWRVA